MAEDTRRRYPQATPDGDAIPFEIIRPYGLIIVPVTDVPSGLYSIPANASFLVLRATQPCYMLLGDVAIAAAPAYGVHTPDLVYIDGGEVLVIDHDNAANFSVLRMTGESGLLIVQTCRNYTDIRKSAQFDRA